MHAVAHRLTFYVANFSGFSAGRRCYLRVARRGKVYETLVECLLVCALLIQCLAHALAESLERGGALLDLEWKCLLI